MTEEDLFTTEDTENSDGCYSITKPFLWDGDPTTSEITKFNRETSVYSVAPW